MLQIFRALTLFLLCVVFFEVFCRLKGWFYFLLKDLKKMMQPKISIIIPVYNVEKYLTTCLESVRNQTFKDFEAICINDGSTDNSLEILKDFQKKDERIKIITQENQGSSVARNRGLKEAKGDYIYFLDSDDSIHPKLLEICLYFALKNDAELVCFGFERSDGKNNQIEDIDLENICVMPTKNPLFWLLRSGKFKISFNVWTKFYMARLAKSILFIQDNCYEDVAYTLQTLLRHPKTIVLDAKFYFYTQNMSSISNKKANLKNLKDYRTVLHHINDGCFFSATHRDLQYIRHYVYPRCLNNQYRCCQKAKKENKHQMLCYFAQSLRQYQAKRMISLIGCGIFKYLRYRFMMLKY